MASCRRSAIAPMLSILLLLVLSGCAIEDSKTAQTAQHSLVGWSERDVQTCLGAPTWQSKFGDTDILTYAADSTFNHNVSIGLPFVIGVSTGGGGYCHVVVTTKDARVQQVRYVGEINAPMAPDAFCAPIVRSCVEHPPHSAVPTGTRPTAPADAAQ
jgi:hypothetical protein